MSRLLSLSNIRKICVLSLTAIVISTSSAMAQANSEDATKLKTLFTNYIQKTQNEVSVDGSELVAKGAVQVEEKGSYYAVTLPDLSLKTAVGGKVDIGVIAVNALPAKSPEQWKMTMAIPSPIIAYDSDGDAEVVIEIGQQSFAGIFHERYDVFLKLKAQYNDMAVKVVEENIEVRIPSSEALYNLEQNPNGTYSGPNDFKAENISVIKDGEKLAQLGEVRFDSQFEDYSLEVVDQYLEQIEAVNEVMATEGDGAMDSPQHIIGMYNLVFKLIGESSNGFDIDMSTKDVYVKNPEDPEKSFKLDKASLGLGMSGFQDDRVRLQYRINYEGFNLPALDAQLKQMVPTRMNLNVSLNDLPFRQLVNLGQTSLQGALEQPQAGQMIGLQAMMMLPQLLTDASSNMTLDDNYVGNDQYNVSINGIVTADHTAVKGGYGNATVEIFGLDRLITMTEENMRNSNVDASQRMQMQKMLGGLTAIQMFGQQRSDTQGRPVRGYDLELTKDGKAMLNGSDLMAVMGGR